MQSRRGPSSPESDSAPVTFQDVAACFSEEEWKLLHQWQEELYSHLMKEIHQALISLGPVIASSVFSLRANEKEDLWPMDNQDPERRDKITSSPSFITPGVDVFSNSRKETEHEKDPQDTDRRESSDNLDAGSEATLTVMSATIKEEEETDLKASQDPNETKSIDSPAGDPVVASEQLSQSFLHKHEILLKAKEEEEVVLVVVVKEEQVEEKKEKYGGESSGDPLASSELSQCFLQNSETLLKEEEVAGGESSAHKSDMGGMNEMELNTLSGCKKTSTDNVPLKQHQRIQDSERFFPCTECEKIFNNKVNLVEHEQIHKGLKPFPCTDCKKSFALKRGLKRHQKTHTGERPFSCTVCEKSFTQTIDLQRHQRTHTGMRPFSCTECEKSFTQKIHMEYHQRTHTGVRPFSCTECDRSFTRKLHLQCHQRTHTIVRPFSCAECEKSFAHRESLQRHQRIHTGRTETFLKTNFSKTRTVINKKNSPLP